MFLSGIKKQTVKVRDQSVYLKETKELYGRFMVLARSNRDMDLKKCSRDLRISLTPRALFAPDGSILPCTDKSKLIHYLEKLGENNEIHENAQATAYEEHVDEAKTSSVPSKSPKIVIVDGMVLVQHMANKPGRISSVKDIGQHFNDSRC